MSQRTIDILLLSNQKFVRKLLNKDKSLIIMEDIYPNLKLLQ